MKRNGRYLVTAALVCLLVTAAGDSRATEEQAKKQDVKATSEKASTDASTAKASKTGSDEAKPARQETAADTTMTLKGGEEGTIFKSLRIEGEDRVRIEFDRPPLDIEVDPHGAPGLDWEGIRTVLDRRGLDLVAPYMTRTSTERPPAYARPWLDHFATGDVARFRPSVEGVDRWRLTVANSRGETVANFEGKGKPPKEIGWDGKGLNGKPVPPGLRYSYVLEAFDRAGNKRNFVGDGFELPAYRIHTRTGTTVMFGAAALKVERPADHTGPVPPAAILLETASWINQRPSAQEPVRIEVTARSFDDAQRIADTIVKNMKPLLLGDPVRVQTVANVQPDAADRGTVAITVSAAPAPPAPVEQAAETND